MQSGTTLESVWIYLRETCSFEDGLDRFLAELEDLCLPRFERKSDVGRAWRNAQFQETPERVLALERNFKDLPDAVCEFERVVEHVWTLNVPPRDVENIRAFQLGRYHVSSETAGCWNRSRQFILRRDVFPSCQEDFLGFQIFPFSRKWENLKT